METNKDEMELAKLLKELENLRNEKRELIQKLDKLNLEIEQTENEKGLKTKEEEKGREDE